VVKREPQGLPGSRKHKDRKERTKKAKTPIRKEKKENSRLHFGDGCLLAPGEGRVVGGGKGKKKLSGSKSGGILGDWGSIICSSLPKGKPNGSDAGKGKNMRQSVFL